jgi:antitoxin (DNA-binding transcriptional repressor) of toxin-antitoxin stability system
VLTTTVDEEAKLSELLDRIERGEEVTVLRDGAPVAQIVSFEAAQRMAAVREAMARIDERAERMSLGGLKIKDLINEGRR